jgi:uncharacterized protein (DUF849 family)
MMASAQRRVSVAIAVAPNGARRTKADHPALPLTAAELARTAAECLEAGAAMIHLHVRDAAGRHLLDAAAYRDALAAITSLVEDRLVLQITSESVGRYAAPEQMAVVREVRPEAVSLALRELAPDVASEPAFAGFLNWLKREHVAPQIIVYSPEEAVRLSNLVQRGVVPWDEVPVLFVLGRYGDPSAAAPADLDPFLAPHVPAFGDWMMCAFGPDEAACALAAARAGGSVRVGFENNLWRAPSQLAIDNAAQVCATARLLGDAGLRLATASQLRERWALN